jgi:hypothetical protein
MTLTDLCEELRNWFDVSRHFGEFEIENGTIDLDFLQEGQFFRIVGSVFNDGVYQYNNKLELKDEIFNGAIWAMAVPQNVLDVLESMTKWEEKNADALNSPYSSESFGGYSYNKATDENGNLTVYGAFKKALNRWRKV